MTLPPEIDPFLLTDEIEKEIMARLSWMTLKPEQIAFMSRREKLCETLQCIYPQARIISIKENKTFSSLPDQSIDLLIAHFFFPHDIDLVFLLREWRRILRPQGLLIFSGFGPDTLRAWHNHFHPENLPYLMDMHNLGDLFLQTGFCDPVLDVDYLTFIYQNKTKLLAELHANDILKTISLSHNAADLPAKEGKWHAVYEIIYAHAFVPEIKALSGENGVTRIAVDSLRAQLKEKNTSNG